MSKPLKTTIGTDLTYTAELLDGNNVIGIPTQTVYDLAANALNLEAVQQIFRIKNRPFSNPLIVHVACIEQDRHFTKNIPEAAFKLIEEFSPGLLTVLLPKNDMIPDVVTARLPQIAVRIPDHEVTLSLQRDTGFPLAGPSANPFGYFSAATASHVMKMVFGTIKYILDGGKCSTGIESTVIGFHDEPPTVFRSGAISLEKIEQIIGPVQRHFGSGTSTAPGMLPSHYRPYTPLILSCDVDAELCKYKHLKVGLITYDNNFTLIAANRQILLSIDGQLQDAAKNLYAAMQSMDEQDYQLIVVKKMPDVGIGAAMNDRLLRAAKNK